MLRWLVSRLFIACFAVVASVTHASSTNELPQSLVDNKVTIALDTLRATYTESQQHSLAIGQARWVEIRNEACVTDGHRASNLNACLQRVDNERIQELNELLQIRRYELHAKIAAIDLEAVLDKPMDISTYSSGSNVYFDGDLRISREPKSCRELYTLSAGAWSYGGDTPGINSSGIAFTTCQMLLFSAQAQVPRKSSSIDFGDITLYANDLVCLVRRCDDSESVSNDPDESFKSLSDRGKLKIESGQLPAWGMGACKDVLVLNPPYFCLDGLNVKYEVSRSANYTRSSEREALLHAFFFPAQGSMRVHYLLLASYDPDTHSIQVRQIDPGSRIKLRLADY